MSIFSKNMNMGTIPAFGQMSEFVQIGGVSIEAIYDPVSKTTDQSLGGIEESNTTNVYIKKIDAPLVKKGDKVTFTQDGDKVFKGRINIIINDDTDLVTLQCGGLLKGVVPGI